MVQTEVRSARSTEDAAEFAGQEVSLRDPAIRARVGLA